MRVFIQTLIISSILLMTFTTNGQTVSNDNGIKDFIPRTIKRSFANITDPIHDWPGCADPKALQISEVRDDLLISWDGNLKTSDKYSYELVVSNVDTKATIKGSTINQNSYKIEKSYSRSNFNIEVKVRRVCKDNNNAIVYSNWVTAQYTPAEPCNGGGISSVNSVCSGSSATINSSSPSSGGNITWQYKFGDCSSAASWYPIDGATGLELVLDTLLFTKSYRRVIDCSGLIIYSNCVTIIVNSNPPAVIGAASLDICSGESTILSSTGGSTLTRIWSNGATTSSITVSPLSTTTYTVTVTQPIGGCTASKSATVNVTNYVTPTITSVNVGQCDSLTNRYSISYHVQFSGSYSGRYYYYVDNSSNGMHQASFDASTGQTITVPGSLAADGGTHTIYILGGTCFPATQITYTAPQPCSSGYCSISGISVGTPLNCLNSTYDLPISFIVQNTLPNQQVQISYLGSSTILTVGSNGATSGILYGINYGTTGSINITSLSPGNICSSLHIYTALQSVTGCNPTACTIAYTGGQCDGSYYNVTGVVNIPSPTAGSYVTVTDFPSMVSKVINMQAGVSTYYFQLDGLTPDGNEHVLQVGGTPCADAVASTSYNSPSACGPAPQCGIVSKNIVVSACDPLTNKYSLSGSITINCVLADVLTITHFESNTILTIATNPDQSTYSFFIPDLNSDGKTSLVGFETQYSANTSLTMTAPGLCGSTPLYECGDPYSLPSITNTSSLLERCNIGDVVEVAGILFTVTEVSGSNGIFTGKGEMSIPFNKKKLKVSFNNITINSDYEVVSGFVEGVTGALALQDLIVIDTFSIGGDICIVEPAPEGRDMDDFDNVTGLNSRGFGRDSLYYPGGTKYDENGYDYSGINRDTGTPYNSSGCDMNGYDIDKVMCVTDSTTIMTIDSIYNELVPGMVDTKLGEGLQKMIDSLATFDCNAIRVTMDSKITALGYGPDAIKYIKGETNEYYNKGMNVYFTSEPKPLLNNSNREQSAIELEQEHINLYQCDLLSSKLEKMIEQLREINNEKFYTYIKKELGKLDKTKLQELKDSNEALTNWLILQITSYAETGGIGSLYSPSNEIDIESPFQQPLPHRKRVDRSSAYFSTASIDGDYDFTPAPGEEESWLFNQGYKNIKGVDRGYYLEELYKQLQQEALLVGDNDAIVQPILISKDSAGIKYNIYLDNIKISSTGAKLDAYFIFTDPNSGKKLVMKALNINWGTGGMIGDTKLVLGSAIEIRLSNAAILRLNPASPGVPGNGANPGTPPTEGTYVSWDCKGFKSIRIDADVELCRNLVTPLDATTLLPLPDPERFSVRVITELTHWSDFYFEISANKAFAITGYEQYKWKLESLVVDMSDYKSPAPNSMFEGFKTKNYKNGVFESAWRGFYLKRLSVTFPNSFSSSGQPITAGVDDVVIDDMGASGVVYASNLVNIEQGSLGGWPFSLDTAKLVVLHNHVVGGGLAGQLKVPVFKDPMRYTAMMYPGNKFEFTVKPTTDQEMDMLLASVTLKPNSSIKVNSNDGEVLAIAELNGTIEVGKFNSSGNGMKLPSADFTGFRVSNKAPYFDAGEWKVNGGLSGKLAGFELNIDQIQPFQDSDEEAGLSLKVGVTFPCNLSAFGGLEVRGIMSSDNGGRQKWIHQSTKMKSFGIDASFTAGRVKGYLEFFEENPTYGKGFQGMVKMDFKSVGEFDALALFGSKDFKYFFIDASAKLATGIPAGPLFIDGFVGGVSYRMNVGATPGAGGGTNPKVLPVLGQSFSGNTYIPDSTKALGLRAGVLISLKAKKAFNGAVVFEILFNSESSGGGVAHIVLDGKGQLMSLGSIDGVLKEGSTSNQPSGMNAAMRAHIRFKYDFNARIFTGDLVTFLNAGLLKGVGTGGKMVDAHIYAGPAKWYFHFGTPTNPCGVSVNLGAGQIILKSYLCIGTEIPGLPAVPADVIAIAGNIKPSTAFANSGNGFLFGANFESQAKINIWVGSAELKAKAGFDIMIRDFGDATCAGSSSTLGIDGYYGIGQIWALVEGKLKIAGFTIFSAGIAAVLQAQLPNPFYAQATVGVKVKILFAKVNKNLNIQLGNQCTIDYGDNGSALGMKVISQVLPGNNGKNMPVDAVPQVYFNLPVSTIFDLAPDKFEVRKSTVTLKSLKSGQNYLFSESLNSDKTLLELRLAKVFSSYDSIEMKVKYDVFKNNVLVDSETEIVVFTTGAGYSTIPPTNIEYSYPMDNMSNFYKNEFNQNKGFIQLKSGMPELFYNLPEGTFQKMRLTKEGGESKLFDYDYDGLNAKINFPMDPGMLDGNSIYTLEIVRLGIKGNETVTPAKGVEISKKASNLNFGSILGGSETSSQESNSENEMVLISLKFRVSRFNTFASKLTNMNKITNTTTLPSGYIGFQNGIENFDLLETKEFIHFDITKNFYWWVMEVVYNKLPATLNNVYANPGSICDPVIDFPEEGRINAVYDQYGFYGVPLTTNGTHNLAAVSNSPGIMFCNIQNTVQQDYDYIKTHIQSKFSSSGCYYLIDTETKKYQFDKQYLRPTDLGWYFDNVDFSNLIFEARVSYNIPGVGRTSEDRFNFSK